MILTREAKERLLEEVDVINDAVMGAGLSLKEEQKLLDRVGEVTGMISADHPQAIGQFCELLWTVAGL